MDRTQSHEPSATERDAPVLLRLENLLPPDVVQMIREEGTNVDQSYRLASNIEQSVVTRFRRDLQDHATLHGKWGPWLAEMVSTTSRGKHGALATIPAPSSSPAVSFYEQDFASVDSAMTNLGASLG